MKKPYSKLPFVTYKKDRPFILDANDEMVGGVKNEQDSEYLCWCANNIKEAIGLIIKVHDLISSYEYDTNDSDVDIIDQLWDLRIDEFLNKLDSGFYKL